MNILDIIYVPFGLFIKFFYYLSGNYVLTLFAFALVIKVVLLPLTIKNQKGQIRMAQLRPKEQAIRKKYAGRNDTVTQQKVQSELMEMYKSNNYSPMSGCWPMLLQLVIIIALYSIIRQPLHYIAGFSNDTVFATKKVAVTLFKDDENYRNSIFKSFVDKEDEKITNSMIKNIPDVSIIKIMSGETNGVSNLERIKADVNVYTPSGDDDLKNLEKIPDNFKNINLDFFGHSLGDSPAEVGFSIFLLIPILNFGVAILQSRLTKIFAPNPAMNDAANANKSMKIMEYSMPLLVVYTAYTFSAALGIYWIFQNFFQIIQTVALAKIYPIPKISEEDYKLAEKEYGVKEKTKEKKKPRRPYQDDDDDDLSDTREGEAVVNYEGDSNGDGQDSANGENDKELEKYISDEIPKGISPAAKNNYRKTGEKYNIKKRKK